MIDIKLLYFFFFIFLDLINFFFILSNGKYTGDVRTKELNLSNEKILFILLLIILMYSSYYLISYLFTNKIKLKTNMKKLNLTNDNYLDYFMALLLVMNILFFLKTGSGLAGGTKKVPFSFIRQIFPLQFFYYIYYCLKRKKNNALFKLLIFSFIGFNLLRGWTGHLLYFFMLELYFRTNGFLKIITVIKILFFSLFVPMIYSLSYKLKMFIRINSIVEMGYIDSFQHLTGRLSSISNIAYILEIKNELIYKINNNLGHFSFIKESIGAIVPNRLLPFTSHDSINHFLTLIAYPTRKGISFKTGIIGKFIPLFEINNLEGIFFIFYVIFLVLLVHFIGLFYHNNNIEFLIFLVGINFLLGGNLSIITLFIYSLLIFQLVIKIINLVCQFNKKIKRRKQY